MDRKKEFLVGIFVIIGITCLITGMVTFGKISIGKNYYIITSRFNNVINLELGTPVLMGGVKIGKVASIYLDKDQVFVDLYIKKYVKIRKGAKISINYKGFLGDLIVIVVNPKTGGEYFKEGESIVGYDPTSIGTIMQKMSELTDKFSSMNTGELLSSVGEIKTLLKNTDKAIVSGTKTLGNVDKSLAEFNKTMESTRKLAENTNGLLTDNRENIKKSTATAEKVARELKETVVALRKATEGRDKDLENLLHLTSLMISDIDSVVKDNSGKFAGTLDSFGKITQKVDQIIEAIDSRKVNDVVNNSASIMSEFNAIVNDLNELIKTIKKLAGDKESASLINSTLKNADEISKKMDSILSTRVALIPEIEVNQDMKLKANAHVKITETIHNFYLQTGRNNFNDGDGTNDFILGRKIDKFEIGGGLIRSRAGIEGSYRMFDNFETGVKYYDIDKHNFSLNTDLWFDNIKLYMKYDIESLGEKKSFSVGAGYKF